MIARQSGRIKIRIRISIRIRIQLNQKIKKHRGALVAFMREKVYEIEVFLKNMTFYSA